MVELKPGGKIYKAKLMIQILYRRKIWDILMMSMLEPTKTSLLRVLLGVSKDILIAMVTLKTKLLSILLFNLQINHAN